MNNNNSNSYLSNSYQQSNGYQQYNSNYNYNNHQNNDYYAQQNYNYQDNSYGNNVLYQKNAQIQVNKQDIILMKLMKENVGSLFDLQNDFAELLNDKNINKKTLSNLNKTMIIGFERFANFCTNKNDDILNIGIIEYLKLKDKHYKSILIKSGKKNNEIINEFDKFIIYSLKGKKLNKLPKMFIKKDNINNNNNNDNDINSCDDDDLSDNENEYNNNNISNDDEKDNDITMHNNNNNNNKKKTKKKTNYMQNILELLLKSQKETFDNVSNYSENETNKKLAIKFENELKNNKKIIKKFNEKNNNIKQPNINKLLFNETKQFIKIDIEKPNIDDTFNNGVIINTNEYNLLKNNNIKQWPCYIIGERGAAKICKLAGFKSTILVDPDDISQEYELVKKVEQYTLNTYKKIKWSYQPLA